MRLSLKKIISWIGIAFLFVFILEICARIDDKIRWDAPFFGEYSSEILGVLDSLGYHNRPNARFEKWIINSHGFRGPENSLDKPEGMIRVVIVGASETFGLYESPDLDYPAQMRQILEKKMPGRYEVLNSACPGMSPPRITTYFEKWIMQYDPDVLVYYPSPAFYLDIDPIRADSIIDTPQMEDRPIINLRLPAKATIVMKQFLPKSLLLKMKQLLIKREVGRHPDNWVWEKPPQDRVALFRSHVSKLIETVLDKDVIFIIATHATAISDNMSEDDRNYLIGWRKLLPHVSENSFMQMEKESNNIIIELGKKYGIPVVDIDSLFENPAGYFADHQHFTDSGAAAVAKIMADSVLSATLAVKDR